MSCNFSFNIWLKSIKLRTDLLMYTIIKVLHLHSRYLSWNKVRHTFVISRSFPLQGSITILQRRHNGRCSVSNHQPHHCLLNGLFRHRSNKASKLRVTGPCAGNSPMTGEFLAQMASNIENDSIWWRHHDTDNVGDQMIIWMVLNGS